MANVVQSGILVCPHMPPILKLYFTSFIHLQDAHELLSQCLDQLKDDTDTISAVSEENSDTKVCWALRGLITLTLTLTLTLTPTLASFSAFPLHSQLHWL